MDTPWDSILVQDFYKQIEIRENVIIFGADKKSSVHIDNKNKDILCLGEVKTQGLDHTALTAAAKYHINFTQSRKSFVLSLQFKAKEAEMKSYPLCLVNISKDFTLSNMKN